MATWNQFSDEVRKERQTIRAYGLHNPGRWPNVNSYKAQALRMLAVSLEMEDHVRSLESMHAATIDLLDCANDLDALAGSLNMSVDEVTRLRNKAMGSV